MIEGLAGRRARKSGPWQIRKSAIERRLMGGVVRQEEI
jgi:hypothetical protein